MNTNALLETATGMGYSAKISSSNRSQSSHYTVSVYDNDNVFLNPFNPTIGDLIEFLVNKGEITLITHYIVKFRLDNGIKFYSEDKTLKENLLSVVLEAIKAEKEK